MKRLWIPLVVLTVLTLSTAGCSIGVKEKLRIVYTGFAKSELESQGAIKIATNDKLPVTVVGSDDVATEMDLGGFLAVREADFIELIKRANGDR